MIYDIDKCDIASYADDNTPYTSDFNLEEVIQKLELTTNNLFEWFKNNHMKANADKCHLLVTRDTDVTAKIGELDIKNSREEKLLGVKTDSKLSFENHVSFLCKKASQKLHALARVINFVDVAKRKSLIKAFITSQFNYYPLILICVGFLGVRFEVVVGVGGIITPLSKARNFKFGTQVHTHI